MNAALDVLQSTHLHINRDRLWQSLMDLAKLGATPRAACVAWPLPTSIARPAICLCNGAKTPVAR